MGPRSRSGDLWSGLALAGLGAYILFSARRWEYMTQDGPGAGFFPVWYGGVMLVLSLVLVASAVMKPGQHAQVAWKDVARALVAWVAFVACIALMPVFGFVVSFALLVAFIVKVMCAEKLRTAILVAVIGSAGFYALFEWALDLSLPRGMFF